MKELGIDINEIINAMIFFNYYSSKYFNLEVIDLI